MYLLLQRETEGLPDPKYNLDAIQKASMYRVGSLKGPIRQRPMKRIIRVKKTKKDASVIPAGEDSEDELPGESMSSRETKITFEDFAFEGSK